MLSRLDVRHVITRKRIMMSLYVPIYIGLFFLLEQVVPSTADYWVSYCFLDDMIPFDERFIIFYYMWYPLLFIFGIILWIKDPEEYERYMWGIIIGFTFSLIFCLIFPNGQDLRPDYFPRDNICTDMVKAIYSSDTNTNVLPSVHAIGAFLVMISVWKTKAIGGMWMRWGISGLCLLIVSATCLVKQHSILDVLASMTVCSFLYIVLWSRSKKTKNSCNPLLQ